MQELEKILEEIDNLYVDETDFGIECNMENRSDIACDNCYECIKEACKNIIRKHMNDGWIPVDERLPEPGRIVLITQTYSWENFEEGASVTIGRLSPEKNNKMWEFQYYRPDFRSGTIMDNDIICPGSEYVIAWRPLPEPYHPERSE